MDNLVIIYHGGTVEYDRYGYVEFVDTQSVAEPPNLMPHRSACLPLDTKHSRENTKLLSFVGHTPGENPKIHIFVVRITNERIKLTSF